MTVQVRAPETIVRVNGSVVADARVLMVDLSTGGRRLDNAVIEFFVPGTQRRTSQFANFNFATFTQAEVEIITRNASGKDVVVHWGKSAGYSIKQSGNEEVVQIISRQEHHYFGEPLKIIPVSEKGGGARFVHKPCVFNEEIDGQIFNNRSRKIVAGTFVFVDPESVRTSESESLHGGPPEPWDLQVACNFLCQLLNPFETYIQNPDLANLAVLSGDPKLLRAHPISNGLYLPQALDELLEPYGFSWFVKLVKPGSRIITVFRRGGGTVRTALLQPTGDTVDLDKSNVENVNLGFDVTSRAFNSVELQGDYGYYEITAELMPAWEEGYDTAEDEDVLMDSEAWDDDPKLMRVWRDWVLNEAGDYKRTGYPRNFDFDSIFGKGQWYLNRRKFEPTITKGADGAPIGQSGGITVEWWDASGGTSNTGEWLPIENLNNVGGHVHKLERECGIRFSGSEPPAEIRGQGVDSDGKPVAKIRVTATVVCDKRLILAREAADSLLSDRRELVLDVKSKFKFRKVHNSSIYAVRVLAGELKSTEIEHTAAMSIMADELLENWNQASIDGNLVLAGAGFDAQQVLGEPLGGVSGRNVLLATNRAETKFPTVIGIRIDFERQQTSVTLDTWQREVSSM